MGQGAGVNVPRRTTVRTKPERVESPPNPHRLGCVGSRNHPAGDVRACLVGRVHMGWGVTPRRSKEGTGGVRPSGCEHLQPTSSQDLIFLQMEVL